jgi:two-component system LytT family response regulator
VLAMLDAIAKPPRKLERFAIRSGERTIFVPVDEVDWIEAFQNYVRLHTGPATHLLHAPKNTSALCSIPAVSSTFIGRTS